MHAPALRRGVAIHRPTPVREGKWNRIWKTQVIA